MRISPSSVYFLLLFITPIFIISSCSPYPEADYYEVDGIVSLAPNSSNAFPNWQEKYYINSQGLIFRPTEPDSTRELSFTFYVMNPGNYFLDILTTGFGDHHEDDTETDLTILGPDGFLIDRSTLHLPQDERLRWIPVGGDSDSERGLSFAEPGFYEIRINPRDVVGLQVHKIHLSHSDYVKPSGIGLPTSVSTELNSADMFREQLVMLPPDWYFGLMLGFSNGESISDTERTENSFLVPDAAWHLHTGTNSVQQNGESSDSEVKWGSRLRPDMISQNGNDNTLSGLIENGNHYFLLDGPVSQSDLNSIYVEERSIFPERERSLYLRRYFPGNDPFQLQFPAMVSEPVNFSWSAEPKVDQDGNFSPGGLHQLLESVSDPTLSIYNTPFISFPVVLEGSSDEELFYRTIQLAAFLPSMHLLVDDLSHDSFTDSEIELFRDYADLRSRLFPYIYTHAHITRQTGHSLMGGFRERTGQFRFGDAFLVAPVTEPGSRERSVYFPGEGLWYDYHSGREYRAGQSWMVEAPLRQLPLFVKAGSVIPYRVEGRQVRSGSNDALIVEIYTGDAGSFRLTEDDGYSRDYRRAIAARTMFRYNEVAGQLRLTIGAVQREYSGMDDYRSYELRFRYTGHPESVEVNGEPLAESQTIEQSESGWYYDQESTTLILNLPDRWKHELTEIAITP